MKSYLNSTDFEHQQLPAIGILVTNLGTPEAATPAALRKYLGEFLADPRITELPRWLWWLILHGVILRIRPAKSAAKYQKVWTEAGSPLLTISQAQVQAITERLQTHYAGPIHVALGMRYGDPSLASGLKTLFSQNVQKVIILPLYPQYASSTTGSTFDAVAQVLTRWRWIPELQFINCYHDHPAYIEALASHIEAHWATHGQAEKLLFSYHGIPKRFFLSGDPYHCQCYKTSRLVAERLALPEDRWLTAFQSRFGREEWLKPYTDKQVKALAKSGIKRLDIICPGFSADCLETLEEIDQENRELFLRAGGDTFHYIPALNAAPEHIDALTAVLTQRLGIWSLTTQPQADLQAEAEQRVARMEAARRSSEMSLGR